MTNKKKKVIATPATKRRLELKEGAARVDSLVGPQTARVRWGRRRAGNGSDEEAEEWIDYLILKGLE